MESIFSENENQFFDKMLDIAYNSKNIEKVDVSESGKKDNEEE